MRLVLLRFEGPYQSWGENSKWDDRDTANIPTKSGVIGVISCCMGLERGDTLIEKLHDVLSVSVRADKPGVMGVDFNTIQARVLITAEGKKRSSNTIISRRQYLQDAAFLVVVSCSDGKLTDNITSALLNPKWTPYLGRKSCIPTCPVYISDTNEYENPEHALREFPLLCETKENAVLAQIEDINGIHERKDRIISAEQRKFAYRNVRYISISKEFANVSL